MGLAGCAHPGVVEPPDATLRRFLGAVRAGHLDEAYGLMSEGYRKDHDAAAFQRALHEHRDEVEGAAARLAGGVAVELHAEARYGDGEALPLVVEAGAWRIAADPLDFYPQGTPAEALRSFVRAVERKRYDIVVRFVPAQERKAVSIDQLRARWEGEKRAEIAEEIAEVKAHLADPVEIAGEEARLALGEKRQVRLVREEGSWRVVALR
jgi:hypothetical protein